MINLFINYFLTKDPAHQKEIDFCLERNLDSCYINQVCVLGESLPYGHPKLTLLKVSQIPTFSVFFAAANDYNAKLAIHPKYIYSVFANSDIYFTEFPILPRKNECFALLRWNVDVDGQVELYQGKHGPKKNSQDSWIFRGLIKPIAADFEMGYPGCDNRLAYELEVAGYKVSNPALTFKTFHMHNYRQPNTKTRIQGPYRKVTSTR